MSIQHAIRNILILFFRISGIAFLYRAWMRRRGPLVRIVVFHDVTNESWFDSIIATLSGRYHMLTPQDFFEKRFVHDALNILVTFDDGYASWEYHVAPILEKYEVKALFFINSGLLDVGDDKERAEKFMRDQLRIRPRTALTWEGASLLVNKGHTMGSHGELHVNLAELKREDVRRQLANDRQRIESKLGITITECAYPFGTAKHVSSEVASVAKEVGFLRGYTAISNFVSSDETFLIPRMCIESNATPGTVRAWVEGGYDLFHKLKSLCVR